MKWEMWQRCCPTQCEGSGEALCQPAALISRVRTGGERLEMLFSCSLWCLGSWPCCLQREALSTFLRGIFVWNNFDISNGKTSSGAIPMSFKVLAPCRKQSGGHLLLTLSYWPGHLWLCSLLAVLDFSSTVCNFFTWGANPTKDASCRAPEAGLL